MAKLGSPQAWPFSRFSGVELLMRRGGLVLRTRTFSVIREKSRESRTGPGDSGAAAVRSLNLRRLQEHD